MTIIDCQPFGALPDGTAVERWTLDDGAGVTVAVLTYGATLHSVRAPDRDGAIAEVTRAMPDLAGYRSEAYLALNPYLGATIGRFANRIAGGTFTLDGVEHRIPANDGAAALHGGPEGFDRRVWTARPVQDGVAMSLTSPDGDQGFPGTLEATVTFTLRGTSLTIAYEATTDRPTIVSMTNHAYWNLAGGAAPTIAEHLLRVAADAYTPVGAGGIPTGEAAPVDGTPFDLREPTRIGDRIDVDHAQLRLVGGIDHDLVLAGGSAEPQIELVDPASGRRLAMTTDAPGVQVYTGNFLDGSITDADGARMLHRGAIALEPQRRPDAPNHPSFPDATLRPGDVYGSWTRYDLGVVEA